MEIEVGEYVRTKTGFIGKLNKISNYIINNKNKTMYLVDFRERVLCISIKDIVKHSKNIIDLVEVGDYVNGKLIHKIDKGPNYCYLYYGNCKTFVNYQIKSIVTHEQFSQMEYKVETEEK